MDNRARAEATAASAAFWSATARSAAAWPASSSAFEGTLPPESRATSCSRARLAAVSATVARAWPTRASAAAMSAFAWRTWSRSFEVSRRASTWPFFTRSFTSTKTVSMMPDSSLPTSTELVGCRLPLADTLMTSSPLRTGWVR